MSTAVGCCHFAGFFIAAFAFAFAAALLQMDSTTMSALVGDQVHYVAEMLLLMVLLLLLLLLLPLPPLPLLPSNGQIQC